MKAISRDKLRVPREYRGRAVIRTGWAFLLAQLYVSLARLYVLFVMGIMVIFNFWRIEG